MSGRSEDARMGAIVRRRRQTAQMTQEEVGKAVGTSYQQVQKYETGVNRVSVSRLIDIARALGTTAADLIGELERELSS